MPHRLEASAIRDLGRDDIDRIWTIDRSEVIEAVFRVEGGELVRHAERHVLDGWPEGEEARYAPILRECFDRGGTFLGAFEGDAMVGVVVLDGRFMGRASDQLQLKFLHAGRSQRGTGLGRTLFERASAKARALGAKRLYVSATPSENTVGFYRHLGCRLAAEPDPALYALEPEDIHFELDL